MKNKNYIPILIVLLFFVVGFFLINQPAQKSEENENIQSVKIAGQSIKVELALTAEEQAQGLSGRSELPEGQGMLFVFDRPGRHLFWMKDMNFPIDMIWLDEDKKIIYIKKDARPESYPEMYGPDNNAKYILEVVSGFADKNNLKIGDRVELVFRERIKE